MNVLKSSFIFLVLCLFSVSIYSFNVCNVNFNEPWFEVNDDIGKTVFLIDNSGNMYVEGKDHTLNNKNSYKFFEINNLFFNRITSMYNSISSQLSSLPSVNSLIVKSNSGIEIAKVANNGNIYLKGKAAVQGEQAGCLADGYIYCNGGTRENRDYYCNLIGDKSGSCTYNVVASENCLTKVSTDTDGGIVKGTRGTVIDYTGCSAGSCTYNTYTDYCSSSTNLIEYYASSSSYGSTNINCGNDDYYFCSGLNRYKRVHLCSTGACDSGTNTFVQTCSASSPSYGSWSCSSFTQRARSVTTYEAECSPSGCTQSSSTSTQSENCGSGQVCDSGNCRNYYSCSLPWSGSISHGSSVTAYLSNSVPYGSSCSSQTRTCNDGTLSGNYQYQSCSAQAAASCSLPWGGSISHGSSVTAYLSSGVSCGSSCSSQIRTCNNGALSGSYQHRTCSVGSCSYSWKTGSWGSCSVSCGGGTQTRSVWCERSDGVTVSDSYCGGGKPTISRSCNTYSCIGCISSPYDAICFSKCAWSSAVYVAAVPPNIDQTKCINSVHDQNYWGQWKRLPTSSSRASHSERNIQSNCNVDWGTWYCYWED